MRDILKMRGSSSKHCAARFAGKDPPDEHLGGSEFKDQYNELNTILTLYNDIWDLGMKCKGSHNVKLIEKLDKIKLSTEHFKAVLERKHKGKKIGKKTFFGYCKQTFKHKHLCQTEFEDQDDHWDEIKPLYDNVWNLCMQHRGSHNLKLIKKKNEIKLSTYHFKIVLNMKKNKKKSVNNESFGIYKPTITYAVQETQQPETPTLTSHCPVFASNFENRYNSVHCVSNEELEGNPDIEQQLRRYPQCLTSHSSSSFEKLYGDTWRKESWQFPQLSSETSIEKTDNFAQKSGIINSKSDLQSKTAEHFGELTCEFEINQKHSNQNDTDPNQQYTLGEDGNVDENLSFMAHDMANMSLGNKENGGEYYQMHAVKNLTNELISPKDAFENKNTMKQHKENLLPAYQCENPQIFELQWKELMACLQLNGKRTTVEPINDSTSEYKSMTHVNELEYGHAADGTHHMAPDSSCNVFDSLHVDDETVTVVLQDPNVCQDETLYKRFIIAENRNTSETSYPYSSISDQSLNLCLTSDFSSDMTSDNEDKELMALKVLPPACHLTSRSQWSSESEKGKAKSEVTVHVYKEQKLSLSLAGQEEMTLSKSALVEMFCPLEIVCNLWISKSLQGLGIGRENGSETTWVCLPGSFYGLTLIIPHFMLTQIDIWILNCHEELFQNIIILVFKTTALTYPVIYIKLVDINMFGDLTCLSKPILQLLHMLRQKIQSVHALRHISETKFCRPSFMHAMLTVPRNLEYLSVSVHHTLYNNSAKCTIQHCRTRLPGDGPNQRGCYTLEMSCITKYLKNCTAVWVVSSIHRAIDDKTAKDLLGENFRRQLLMDGQYGSIAFICTKTDVLMPSEIIRSLKLDKETRELETEIKALETENADLDLSVANGNLEAKRLKGTIEELETEVTELQNNLAEIGSLLDPVGPDSQQGAKGNTLTKTVVDNELQKLDKALEPIVQKLSTDMDAIFDGSVRQKMENGASNAASEAGNTCAKWSAPECRNDALTEDELSTSVFDSFESVSSEVTSGDKTSVNKYGTSKKVKSLKGDILIAEISYTSPRHFGIGLDHLETTHNEGIYEQHSNLLNPVQDDIQVCDSDCRETDEDQTQSICIPETNFEPTFKVVADEVELRIDHTSRIDELRKGHTFIIDELRIGHTSIIDDNGPVLNDHDTLDDNNVCFQENETFSAKSSSSSLFRQNSLNEKKNKKKQRRKRQKAGTLFHSPLSVHSVCSVYSTDSSFERSVDKTSNKLHKTVKLNSHRSKKWQMIRRHNSDKDIKKGHRNISYDPEHIVKKKTYKMDKAKVKKICDIHQTMTSSGSLSTRMDDKLSKQTLIRRELESDDSGIMTQTSTDTDLWLSLRAVLREYCERTQHQQIAKDVARTLYIEHAYQLHGTVVVNGLRSFFNRVNTGVPLTHEEELQFEWLRFITFHNYEGEGNGIALARNGFYHDHDQGPNATRCFACDVVHEEWTLLDNVEQTHRRLSPNCPLLRNNSGEGTRRNISIAADDGPQRAASTANVNVRDASGVSQSPSATSTTGQSQSSSISQPITTGSIFPHGRSPANFNHPPTPETIRQLDAAAAARRNASPTSTTQNPVSPLTERLGNAQIRESEEGPRSILAQPIEDPENRQAHIHRAGYSDQDRSVSGIRPSDMFGGGPVGHGAFAAQSLPVTTPQPSQPLRSSSAPLTNLPLTTETVTRSSSSATIAGLTQTTTTPPQQTAVIQPSETEPRRANVALQRSSTPLKTVSAVLERSSQPRGPDDPRLNEDLTTGIYIERPRHPEYNNLQTRIDTFTDWPAHLDQDTRQLAELGFFHVGVADFVRCFACGGGLRNWERGDNPLVEHIRWFPNCEYMCKLKGQHIIDLVLRHVREQEAAEGAAASRTSDLNKTDPLQSELGRSLIDMGFTEDQVKDGITGARQRLGRTDVTANEVIDWLDANRPPSAVESKTPLRAVVRQEERPVQGGASTTTTTFSSTTTTTSSSSRSGTTLTTSHSQVNVEVAVAGANITASTTTATSLTSGGANDDGDEEYETPPEGNTSGQAKNGGKKKKKKKSKGGNAASKSSNEGATTQQTENLDPAAIQKENERLRDMQTCKICMERPVDTTLLPCGHLVTCNVCAQRLAKCPICRKKKEGAVRTFMS